MRVIKVSGSLFDLSDLGDRLRRWLALDPRAPVVAIAGGGRAADDVRAQFALEAVDEEAAHWRCIRIMGRNAEHIHRLLPGSRLVHRADELPTIAGQDRLTVLDPEDYLRRAETETEPPPLPHTWDVTSDSIAARLAEMLGARELVLLKSCLPPAGTTRETAAAGGYVDGYFARAAQSIATVRAVNLRIGGFPEAVLACGEAG